MGNQFNRREFIRAAGAGAMALGLGGDLFLQQVPVHRAQSASG